MSITETLPDIDRYLFSEKPEREFNLSVHKEKARKYGQYFTPYPVARYMADWVNQSKSLNLVLDPAAGLGIFFRALLEGNPNFSGIFYGHEIDPITLEKLNELFRNLPAVKTCFVAENYLFSDDDRKYDAVLCNPPYILYKRIPDRRGLIKHVERESGVRINPQSNVYTYFIIRAALALAPLGRAAFLIPSEFLNSEFGIPVKEFLIKRNLIKKILFFDAKSSIFTDSITTSCILLLENNQLEDSVEFGRLIQQEHSPYLSELPFDSQSEIHPDHKWSPRFINKPVTGHSTRLIPLSKIGRASRGIATGDNRFFTFDDQKIERYDIPESCLLPCLTRASQAQNSIFTQDQFEQLAKSGKSVYLLDACRDPENSSIRAYLRHGEVNGSHNRFLTRSRNPWYRIENRPPAPILFTTFSRNQMRFIRNEANVYNLTCFHSIYLCDEILPKVDVLMAYFLTPYAHSIISPNRREYGNGLIKFEPNDLNTALVADISQMDAKTGNTILDVFLSFRDSVLSGMVDYGTIEKLDALFANWVTQ